jgi:hypothetical protein
MRTEKRHAQTKAREGIPHPRFRDTAERLRDTTSRTRETEPHSEITTPGVGETAHSGDVTSKQDVAPTTRLEMTAHPRTTTEPRPADRPY